MLLPAGEVALVVAAVEGDDFAAVGAVVDVGIGAGLVVIVTTGVGGGGGLLVGGDLALGAVGGAGGAGGVFLLVLFAAAETGFGLAATLMGASSPNETLSNKLATTHHETTILVIACILAI